MPVVDLEAVACEARLRFERHNIPRATLSKLYLAYNPHISAIDGFLDQAESSFPAYNCGLATVYIRYLLHEGTILQGFYLSKRHTFLVLGNTAIDITADQFGGPAIYVGGLTLPWSVR